MTVTHNTLNGCRYLSTEPVVEWIEQRTQPGMFHPPPCPRFVEAFGISVRTLHRWRQGGWLMPVAVEKVADTWGCHPSEIHPDYWDAVL